MNVRRHVRSLRSAIKVGSLLIFGAALALVVATIPVGDTLWAKTLGMRGEIRMTGPSPTPTPRPHHGCSPGFWKQEHHFAFWPAAYPREGVVAEVFVMTPPEAAPTLLEALEEGGGGVSPFLRQAVAALLNAAHEDIDYAYTVDEVLALVLSAFKTDSFDAVKDMFEAANESGCPLPLEGTGIEALSVETEATPSPTVEPVPSEASSATAVADEATATAEAPTPTPAPEEPEASADPPTPTPALEDTAATSEPPTPAPVPDDSSPTSKPPGPDASPTSAG
jgi:hypothetical protein